MYIDNDSEKLFDEYKNKGFDEIYFDNNFKFIKGIEENNEKNYDIKNLNESNSELVSDSFYEYHKNEIDELNKKEKEEIYEIIDSSDEENIKKNEIKEDINESVIELDETISLNSNTSFDEGNDYNKIINKNKNNLQLNNQIYKIPKKINYIDKNKLIDLKIEMNINSIKERIKNQLLQRKRIIEDNIKINKNQIQKKKEGEEVIDVSSKSINESSNFIPIDNEINHQFSTNSN